MGAFIVKQPNGLFCRFSTVLDCPTNWNMTEEEYIELCAERARIEAKETLEHHTRPFEEVIHRFQPNNMTRTDFITALNEMQKEKTPT